MVVFYLGLQLVSREELDGGGGGGVSGERTTGAAGTGEAPAR
jgi:hypothetical protein